MIREALEEGFCASYMGLPATPLPVAGSTLSTAPLSRMGCPATRRGLCERSAPPSAPGGDSGVPTGLGGSPHGLAGVGEPAPPPNWPQSGSVKLAPSPPVTYRFPSGPKARWPMECEGYCWHHWSVISGCSAPVATPVPGSTGIRERLPVTVQPSVVGPGGVGQPSPQLVGLPSGLKSWV